MTLYLNEFHKQVSGHLATPYGTAAAKKVARRSPNLSRSELRRLIADMID